MRTPSAKAVLVGLALAVPCVGVAARRGAGQERATRAQFMRQKLEMSKRVLEGLTLEDYPKIAQAARRLGDLSFEAQWEVPNIPNSDQYIALTADFRQLTGDLERAGKARNLDGATISYLQLTTNCVKCHKYVRPFRQP